MYFSKKDEQTGTIHRGEVYPRKPAMSARETTSPSDVNANTSSLAMCRNDRNIALVMGDFIHRYRVSSDSPYWESLPPIHWNINSPTTRNSTIGTPVNDSSLPGTLQKTTLSFSDDSQKLVAAFQLQNGLTNSVIVRVYNWNSTDGSREWETPLPIVLPMVCYPYPIALCKPQSTTWSWEYHPL